MRRNSRWKPSGNTNQTPLASQLETKRDGYCENQDSQPPDTRPAKETEGAEKWFCQVIISVIVQIWESILKSTENNEREFPVRSLDNDRGKKWRLSFTRILLNKLLTRLLAGGENDLFESLQAPRTPWYESSCTAKWERG